MIELQNRECLDLLKSMPNNSIDFVCIDPPYTDGKGKDVLGGHKIQTKLDLQAIANELYRVAKPNTFYAFFGQMPTIIEWYNAAVKAGFVWKQQVIWNKKNGNCRQNNQLENIVENIYIMKKGNPIFHKINIEYEEQARMNIDNGAKIDSVFRQLSYWKGIAEGKIIKDKVQPTAKRNDVIYDRGIYERTSKLLGLTTINIKNIWAYLPHNNQHRNPITGQIQHPTVKPIPLLERLIELCTPETENITVLDCFAGSGTTAIACQNTNRNFVGCEIDNNYYNICIERIEKNAKKLATEKNVLL
jgi:site-specific DNA-methyltransferase (adenine-specific)